MPLFEYLCTECGHVMEVLEKSGERKRHKCEKCGSARMEKIMSTFGVGAEKSSGGSCPTGTCPLS